VKVYEKTPEVPVKKAGNLIAGLVNVAVSSEVQGKQGCGSADFRSLVEGKES
jgi:hypothetical protein